MASKNVNVEALIHCSEDPQFYMEQDPVNLVVASMKAVAEDVDKTSGEMGCMFRRLIQCAKYQDIQSEDFKQLWHKITMVQKQLEQLKFHLCRTEILLETP
jgi:hypothetical protein